MAILTDQSLPTEVLELLTPIPGVAPTGVEELDNIKPFATLALEIAKPMPDYPECAQLAAEVLKKYSKHLRVAAWLTLAWFKIREFSGLKDGFLLLTALLERYPGACFPAAVRNQIKAIQFVNTSKVTVLLKSAKLTQEKSDALQQAREALALLKHECASRFPDAQVSFTDLSIELNRLAAIKPAKSGPAGKKQIVDEIKPDSAGDASEHNAVIIKDSKVEAATPAAETGEEPPYPQALNSPEPPVAATKTDDSGTAIAESKDKMEAKEIIISSEVEDLLEPIAVDSATGRTDIAERNYFNLSLEISNIRFSVERCIEWATNVLRNSSKDLRVILWLGFAWYRKDGLQGLYDGFVLLGAALQKYGSQLNPLENEARKKAFNFWNQKQLAELIRRGKIDKESSPLYLQMEQVFAVVAAEVQNLLPEANRIVAAVQRSIAEKADEARELSKPAEKDHKEEIATSPSEEISPSKVEKPAVVKSVSVPTAPMTLSTEKDALALIKQAMLFFYQETVDGKIKPRLIVNPAIFALSRALRWSAFTALVAEGKLTMTDAPNAIKQAFLGEHFSNKDWSTIITDIESNFLSGDSDTFRYWLDAQRYIVLALEAKGEAKDAAASVIIKKHLAQLLELAPDLPKYLFKDGKTAVASVETQQWVEEEVKPLAGGGGSAMMILPPIFGEEYDAINQECETARAELPNHFEENAQAMQKAIEGDQRRKGRFLRQLNLANYCHAAKQYNLAKALLGELMQKIEQYQLAEWEPALCLAVWQTAYLTNQALLKNQPRTANVDLEKQQDYLYEKIGVLDIQRALKL